MDERIWDLKERLRSLERKQTLKERKTKPAFNQMLKLRKAVIKAVEVFDAEKDSVPLEVLSLSKRLIYAINLAEQEEEQEVARRIEGEAGEEPDGAMPEDEDAPRRSRDLFAD